MNPDELALVNIVRITRSTMLYAQNLRWLIKAGKTLSPEQCRNLLRHCTECDKAKAAAAELLDMATDRHPGG